MQAGITIQKWGIAVTATALLWAHADPTQAQPWDPDNPANLNESDLIGVWAGELAGQPTELALWPSPRFNRLTGAMIWGECKAAINLHFGVRGMHPGPEAVLPDETIWRIWAISSSPERSISRFVEAPFSFGDSVCPEEEFPGYSISQTELFFIADEEYSTLVPYVQLVNQTELTQQPSELRRSALSEALRSTIDALTVFEPYEQDSTSKLVLEDPNRRYRDIYLNAGTLFPVIVHGVNINTTEFLDSDIWYYLRDTYDMEHANVFRRILWGDFMDAQNYVYYYLIYRGMVEAHGTKCGAFIEERAQIRTTATTTTRQPDYATDHETTSSAVEIDAQFAKAYLNAGERMNSLLRIQSYGLEYMTVLVPLYANRFFDTEGCDSQLTLRLMENYTRSLTGQDPLNN